MVSAKKPPTHLVQFISCAASYVEVYSPRGQSCRHGRKEETRPGKGK